MDGFAGEPFGELDEGLGAHLHGVEIAAIDANDGRAEVGRALHLVEIVGFAKDVEAEAVGLLEERLECGIGVGGDDEENCVGAGGSGFEDLEGIDDEVFTQARNSDDGGGLLEIGERALEELGVGKDGKRGGPRLLPRSERGMRARTCGG